MSSPPDRSQQDRLYEDALAAFGEALARLVRGYEDDADRRRDLLQEIHIALWRSFERFEGQCSMRTWVYRVAHNRAISLTLRRSAPSNRWLALDQLGEVAAPFDADRTLDEGRARERLQTLIRSLKPVDRQIILLYLEGLDAAAIADVTGLSAGNVATKVHRIKTVLIERFYEATR